MKRIKTLDLSRRQAAVSALEITDEGQPLKPEDPQASQQAQASQPSGTSTPDSLMPATQAPQVLQKPS